MSRAIFSVILVLGPAIAFGGLGMQVEMGLAIVAGGIAAAFINIDKIQRVKGAGFEAEMRKVVEDAYATTATLRQLARPLIEFSLHTLTTGNRLGGMDATDKQSVHTELRRLGDELGLNDDRTISQAHERFFRYSAWDHFHFFVESLRSDEDFPRDRYESLHRMMDYGSSDFPTRAAIAAVLQGHVGDLKPEPLRRLDDYLHYVQHRTLRNPVALRRI